MLAALTPLQLSSTRQLCVGEDITCEKRIYWPQRTVRCLCKQGHLLVDLFVNPSRIHPSWLAPQSFRR